MNSLNNALEHATNYLMTIGLADLIDIIIVAYLIYKAIWLIRRTNMYNLAKGLILFVFILWLSGVFKLAMINYILRKAAELGIIALVILFQPELRRVLERLGSSISSNKWGNVNQTEGVIAQVVLACSDMSSSKTGALIIFEKKVSLSDIISTGTIINSDVTAELIKNIFFNKAPLHDGALIIRAGRLISAGCVLPLTKSTNLSKDLGMRHRAGIGLSEQSDAIVIIVSEETGAISVAYEGTIKRHLSSSDLEKILRSELMSEDDFNQKKSLFDYIRNIFKVTADEKNGRNE